MPYFAKKFLTVHLSQASSKFKLDELTSSGSEDWSDIPAAVTQIDHCQRNQNFNPQRYQCWKLPFRIELKQNH